MTVDLEDERLTSKLAERKRLMFGVSKKNYDKDAAAAAEILQTFMDSHFRHEDPGLLNQ
jgi:RNase H-fold protein (predicted Holliday junction resolvase)